MAKGRKPTKWRFMLELPMTEGCSEKVAKEKVAIAVGAAFSRPDTDVKVKSEKRKEKKAVT